MYVRSSTVRIEFVLTRYRNDRFKSIQELLEAQINIIMHCIEALTSENYPRQERFHILRINLLSAAELSLLPLFGDVFDGITQSSSPCGMLSIACSLWRRVDR
jgi:hypothetical protein